MIDKEYILSRLNAGESMEDIGNSLAAVLNEAQAAYNAQKQADALESKRIELLNQLLDTVREWALLEGMDAEDLVISEHEAAQLMEGMLMSFQMAKDLKSALLGAHTQPKSAPRAPMTDDQILTEFAKMFS